MAGVSKRSHTVEYMKEFEHLYLDDQIRLKICSEYLSIIKPQNRNNGLVGFFEKQHSSRNNTIRCRWPTKTLTFQSKVLNQFYNNLDE